MFDYNNNYIFNDPSQSFFKLHFLFVDNDNNHFFTQLYDIKYSFLVLIIHTQLNGLKKLFLFNNLFHMVT